MVNTPWDLSAQFKGRLLFGVETVLFMIP